jgi:hypothetical protein
MKTAFLVLGPESSGTRFITKLLLDAGCFGDGDHDQRLDILEDRERINEDALPKNETPIVWRRSYPHRGIFVDIGKAVVQLQAKGYDVWAVVTSRDWFPMLQSQVNVGHVLNEPIGQAHAQMAYRYIFKYLPEDVPFIMVSYESFGRFRRKAVCKMLEMLGLAMPRIMTTIEDGNVKWYT